MLCHQVSQYSRQSLQFLHLRSFLSLSLSFLSRPHAPFFESAAYNALTHKVYGKEIGQGMKAFTAFLSALKAFSEPVLLICKIVNKPTVSWKTGTNSWHTRLSHLILIYSLRTSYLHYITKVHKIIFFYENLNLLPMTDFWYVCVANLLWIYILMTDYDIINLKITIFKNDKI